MLLTLLAVVAVQTPTSRPAVPPTSRPSGETLAVASVVDKVVAIVNDEVITQSEIDTALANLIATQGVKDQGAIERAREEQKITLAYQLLLTQAAKKLAFDDKQIDEGAKKRVEDEEKRAGGRAALHRNIQSQGKSVAEWEREQRNMELIERLLLAEIGYDYRPEKEIVITPTLLRNFYRENTEKFKAGPMVHAREIYISDAKARSRANALARAKDLVDRIKAGSDFSDLAREHSEVRAAYGGEIGWFERDKAGPDAALLEFLFTHDAGTVSDPIEVEGGVAILKVEAKRAAGLRPFRDQDTQEEIARQIYNSRRLEMRQALFRRLQSEAYVWPQDLFHQR